VSRRARILAREGVSLCSPSFVDGSPSHLSTGTNAEIDGVAKAFAVGAEGVSERIIGACKKSHGLVVVLETLCGTAAMKVIFVL
jgi:hypothetical protein